MTERIAQRQTFLAEAGFSDATPVPLAGDASNRRYFRLAGLVLMDAPPETGEDVRPFIAVTHWLRSQGFSAPQIMAADAAQGFLLLEDLGDGLYTSLLRDQQAAEADLYGAAVDLLAEIGQIAAPSLMGPRANRVALAPYDGAVLTREARLLTEWWVVAATDGQTSNALSAELDALVCAASASVSGKRDTVVLRDYHADNLVWLPERGGHARVGLLDYQDALAGHPAYDVMSLLEDARRDTTEGLRKAMIARYLARCGSIDADAFQAAYSILGAQRNMKIIGIFARLALRDGKPRYLSMIPRVWEHLMRDLAHPALGELSAWVERHVPAPEPQTLARIAALAACKTTS